MPNKMSTWWIDPGKIEAKIPETNYDVSVPVRRENLQIYQINLLKHNVKRVERVHVLTHEFHDPDETQGLDTAYPLADSVSYDFSEEVVESE